MEKQPLTRLSTSLLAVCALLLAVLLGTQLVSRPAEAQRAGPFMLVAHSNVSANVGVFRIDQSSGQVSFCTVEDKSLNVRCGGGQ